MRRLNNTTETRMRLSQFSLLLTTLLISNGVFADTNAEADVKAVISKIYDKPDLKVDTAPVVVSEGVAIADWTQGDRGGRALLKNINGQWAIVACGADGFKEKKNLLDAGIPSKTADSLLTQLTKAEKSVNPQRLKLFSLFGTKDDPKNKEEGHHHGHHHEHQ